MKFSLVIPTIGRVEPLRELLAAFGEQSLADFEVLVVDQSGGAAIGEMLSEFAGRFPLRHLPMTGRGAARARNYGWSFARGEIINFPDDDSLYPPTILAQVAERLAAEPALGGLTTRVETMGRADPDPGPITRDNIFGRCVEFALFFRREAAGDLRFDENMGVGCSTPWGSDEGPDLMLRLMAHGLNLYYDPNLVIYHPDPDATPDDRLLRRNYSYSCGRGYLLRKHGYPLSVVGYSLVRSLGGSVLMGLTGRFFKARYYFGAFAGKVRGYLNGGGSEPQHVTSPLQSH